MEQKPRSADKEAEPEHMPPPSVWGVLFRVQNEAIIAVLGPRKGARFLRHMAATLADEDAVAQIFPIRPADQHAAVVKARRGAIALFRQLLPTFMARLDRE